MMARYIALAVALLVAGCGPQMGAENPVWGQMTGTGLGMLQGPRAVQCYGSGGYVRCW